MVTWECQVERRASAKTQAQKEFNQPINQPTGELQR